MAEPRVRFKPDNGCCFPAWQEYELDEILTERNEPHLITEDAPQLSFTIERGVIYPEDKKTNKRDFLMKDKDNKKFLLTEFNDIIYNPANLKFGAIHRNALGRGVVSPIYAIFYTNQNPEFIESVVTNPKFIKSSLRYLEGTVEKLKTLKPRDFVKMRVWIPCPDEQQKIADFLASVDEVISASEQEVANLETQKKAVMKKIFLQEVRFKKADGSEFPEWKKDVLGNLAVFSKGQGYKKSDLADNGYPIILYGRLYTKYQTVISSVDTFAELKPRSILSKKGDIIVPASGESAEDISVAAVVDADGIILGGDLNIIHPYDDILSDYLAYALTYGTPHQEMAKRAQGKSVVHLHNDDLKSAVIVYPHPDEQRLIADFLSDFDEAIAAAKRELELWKELKKGLLQQMFV